MKIAYMWPSGYVEPNQYACGWGISSPPNDMRTLYNVGDLFVTESSLRLVKVDTVKGFQTTQNNILPAIKEINNEFDVVFVRGANTISDEPYADALADILEGVQKPVITLGIGIQAKDDHSMPSSSGAIRLTKILGEKCKTVGLRGERTAEFFRKHGVKNTRIIGCPSILRHNNSNLRVHKKDWNDVHTIGFSLTRGASSHYVRNVQLLWDTQKRLIKEIYDTKKLVLITQSELEEKAYSYRDTEAMKAAAEKLKISGWLDNKMAEIYNRSCIFFSPRPTDYDMISRTCDATVGTRLHGNAMALACGVPPITLAIDIRVKEIYDFWKLPNIAIEEATSFSVRKLYEEADFSEFNHNYPYIYNNMREYFEENDIEHHMLIAL